MIAEADKFPLTIHCIYGADRTGVISFALLTLLGCEYEDIARDYCFTNFSYQGFRDITSLNTWWNNLVTFEGETKAEKCKSWLIQKGIEESILEHIRAIFIEGYKENNESKSYKNKVLNEYEIKNHKKFLDFLEK